MPLQDLLEFYNDLVEITEAENAATERGGANG